MQTTPTARPPVRRALALALACGAALLATAAAAARPTPAQPGAAPVSLEIEPARAVAELGRRIVYTAEAVDAGGRRTDATGMTDMTFTPDRLCHPTPTGAGLEVNCREPGLYDVVGVLRDPRLESGHGWLRVVTERVPPRIASVRRDPSPPNREVEVTGSTGSCNQRGILTLQETHATTVPVAGEFTAKLKIPARTFPGRYRLVLVVDCDEEELRTGATVTVENQPPSPVNDQVIIDSTPGATVRVEVLKNDRDPDDPDGYETRMAVERGPAHGTVKLQSDQAIGYTPGEGFRDAGEDRFTYRVCDVIGAGGALDCGTATVTVLKRSPEPEPDAGVTVAGQPVVLHVMRNDRNAGNVDIARLRVRREPAPQGEAQPQSDGTIVYRPKEGFTGTDTFHYDYCGGPTVLNTAQACQDATVTVTVEQPPVDPRIGSVDRNPSPPNREVVVKGTTGTCDKAATLTLDSKPKPAAPVPLTGGRDGAFEAKLQIPAGTFVGAYQLQLHVVCVGKPEVVRHELKVANQPPSRAADDPASTTMNTPVTIDVTANDVDPDGDDGYRTSLDPGRPEHGTAVEQQPGNRIRYRPEAGFTGVDRFRYRFCDVVDAHGTRDCGAATVIVTVGEPPPEAVDDSASTMRDRPVRIEVMGNDSNPDPAKVHVSRQPTPPATAVVQRQPPGSILYTPAKGFTGTDTFQYDYCGGSVVVDAAGRAACTPATVTVTVNRPDPVPVDDPQATTLRDQPVVIDVMGNDGDPDAARLRRKPRPQPSGRPEPLPGGSIRYTPAPGFVGTDRFGYDYCGGPVDADAAGRACPFATVTVTVTATPVISSVRPGSSPAGRPVEVTGNTGSCQRAGRLSLQETTAAVAVTGHRDGGFTTSLAVPPGTFPGEYRLELRVDCNGQVQRAEATLRVTNRAPEAVDDAAATRDHSLAIPVTRNDRDPDDPDGYRSLVLVTGQPAHGAAEVQPDQTILYTPASGFVGQDRFGYSLCDDVLNAAGAADCGSGTVTVTVSAVACLAVGGPPRLEVAPGKGPGGTRLNITTAVDRRLAGCPLRFLLGGTPLGPDVRVGVDGSISAERGVPMGVKPGRSTLRLATMSAQTLAERPFEVLGGPIPWPVRLALGMGALLVGALARIAFRRWRASREQRSGRRPTELPDDVRAEPHTRPVEVGVEPVPDGTRTFSVRLQPHADPGTQTFQEG